MSEVKVYPVPESVKEETLLTKEQYKIIDKETIRVMIKNSPTKNYMTKFVN